MDVYIESQPEVKLTGNLVYAVRMAAYYWRRFGIVVKLNYHLELARHSTTSSVVSTTASALLTEPPKHRDQHQSGFPRYRHLESSTPIGTDERRWK